MGDGYGSSPTLTWFSFVAVHNFKRISDTNDAAPQTDQLRVGRQSIKVVEMFFGCPGWQIAASQFLEPLGERRRGELPDSGIASRYNASLTGIDPAEMYVANPERLRPPIHSKKPVFMKRFDTIDFDVRAKT